jgi:sarcosine oxidase subunit alpha
MREDGTGPPSEVVFRLDGEPVAGRPGEPVGVSLFRLGLRTLGWNEGDASPRGLYCLIGHCFECRLEINGMPQQRACLVPVAEGLEVRRMPPPPRLATQAGGDRGD